MGKVASSTIYKNVSTCEGIDVQHIHTLNEKNINNHLRWCKEHSRKPYEHFKESLKVKDMLAEKKVIKIISLVRDPIRRNISAFFQNLDDIYLKNDSYSKYQVNELILKFIESYQHKIPLTWFDNEFKQFLNIDVFQEDFNKMLGYQVYQQDNVEALVLRADLNNIDKRNIVSHFLGTELHVFDDHNVATEKEYSASYKQFLDRIVLPDSFVRQIYASKYSKHFFSEKENNTFAEFWLHK